MEIERHRHLRNLRGIGDRPPLLAIDRVDDRGRTPDDTPRVPLRQVLVGEGLRLRRAAIGIHGPNRRRRLVRRIAIGLAEVDLGRPPVDWPQQLNLRWARRGLARTNKVCAKRLLDAALAEATREPHSANLCGVQRHHAVGDLHLRKGPLTVPVSRRLTREHVPVRRHGRALEVLYVRSAVATEGRGTGWRHARGLSGVGRPVGIGRGRCGARRRTVSALPHGGRNRDTRARHNE